MTELAAVFDNLSIDGGYIDFPNGLPPHYINALTTSCYQPIVSVSVSNPVMRSVDIEQTDRSFFAVLTNPQEVEQTLTENLLTDCRIPQRKKTRSVSFVECLQVNKIWQGITKQR